MKNEEKARLETVVRAANPYPSAEVVSASEELVRMDALVQEGTGSGSVQSVHGRDNMQTQQQPPRQGRRQTRLGWAVAGFAFAVVLIIGFGLTLLRVPDGGEEATMLDQPTSTTPASPTSAPQPTVTTTAVPVEPPVVPTWQQVGTQATESVVGLSDLAATSFGFVVAGFNPGENLRQDGVILLSQDGVSWERVGSSDPALTTGTAFIEAIVEGGPGLVAVGWSCEDDGFPCETGPFLPTAWSSVDGSAWTRSAVGNELGTMIDVIASDSGLVAAGSVTEFDQDGGQWTRPTVWVSDDGIDWSRTWQGAAAKNDSYPPARGVVGGLATGPEGLTIAFGKADDGTGGAVVAVWSSTDGETWERVEADSGAFATETGVIPLDAAWGPTGFVMVGSEAMGSRGEDEGFEVAIWHSADGRGWSRIDTSDQDFGLAGSFGSIAGNGSGFAATTGPFWSILGEGPVSVWTSPDGLAWNDAGVVAEGYSAAIIATETGMLLAGATVEDENYAAAIWLGPILDPLSATDGN